MMSVLARYGDQYWTSHYGVATPTYHAPGAQQAADQLQVGVTCHEASRHTVTGGGGGGRGGGGAGPLPSLHPPRLPRPQPRPAQDRRLRVAALLTS